MWILLLVILVLMHAVNPDCHKFYQNMSNWKHIAGSTLDFGYVKKSILKGYEVEIVVINTYFCDHDAVRVKISKKDTVFMIT